MNVPLMIRWIFTGVVHACFSYWIPYLAFAKHDTVVDPTTGMADGFAGAGFTGFLSLVWSMQAVVIIQTWTWTRSGAGIIAFSMVLFYLFALAYAASTSFSYEFYGAATVTFSRPAHWLSIFLAVGCVVTWDFVLESLRLQFFPRLIDIKRENAAGWVPMPPARHASTDGSTVVVDESAAPRSWPSGSV
jgi:hypothetical protein